MDKKKDNDFEKKTNFNIYYKDFMNSIKREKTNMINKKTINQLNNNKLDSIYSSISILNKIFSTYFLKFLNSSIYHSLMTFNLSEDFLDLNTQLNLIDKQLLFDKNNLIIINEYQKQFLLKNEKEYDIIENNKLKNNEHQHINNSIIFEKISSKEDQKEYLNNIEDENNGEKSDQNKLLFEENNININKINKYDYLTFQEYLNEEIKQIKKLYASKEVNNKINNKKEVKSLIEEEIKQKTNESSNHQSNNNNKSYSKSNLLNLNFFNNNKIKKTNNLIKRKYSNNYNFISISSNSSYSSYKNSKKLKYSSIINYSNLNIIKNKNDNKLKKEIIKNAKYNSFRKGLNYLNKSNQEDIQKYRNQKKFYEIKLYDNNKNNLFMNSKKKNENLNRKLKRTISEKKESETNSKISHIKNLEKEIIYNKNNFKTSFSAKKINKKKLNIIKSNSTNILNKNSGFSIKIDLRDLMKYEIKINLKHFQKSNSETILNSYLINNKKNYKNIEDNKQ